MAEVASPATIAVEVAYAEPARQFLQALRLPAGSRVADAIAAFGRQSRCDVDLAALDAGVWSKPVPRDAVLRDGDRVELYRPLQADPKDARRRRAATRAKVPPR